MSTKKTIRIKIKNSNKKRVIKVRPKRFFISLLISGLIVSSTVVTVKKCIINRFFSSNMVKAYEISSDKNTKKGSENKIIDEKSMNNKQEPKVNVDEVNKKSAVSKDDILKDAVFFGDSITESLSFYQLLDESQVVGIKGLDVVKAEKQVDKLIEGNPKKLFILLGSNDVESGMSSKQFIENYKKLIEILKSKLPNCKIYIQSILPVMEKAKQKQPNFSDLRISEFNDALKKMSQDENLEFIDLLPIIEGKSNLYEPDGIHFKNGFYDLWVDYLKNKLFLN